MGVIDQAQMRSILGHFCSGITIITAHDQDGPAGMTCQSFSSVSLDPPLVLFCPAKSSTSWPRIRAAGHFCANVLGEDQEELCRAFATSGGDKFSGVEWRPGPSGAPIIRGALAIVDCELEVVHEAGDHDLVIGRVLHLDAMPSGRPLLFFRGGYARLAG